MNLPEFSNGQFRFSLSKNKLFFTWFDSIHSNRKTFVNLDIRDVSVTSGLVLSFGFRASNLEFSPKEKGGEESET